MFGERLKLARMRLGLSLRALSDKLGNRVTAQAIGKYERGEMKPGSEVLGLFAKVLEVTPQYLLSEQVLRLSDIDFRKRSGTSARHRATIEAAVIEKLQRYCAIERIIGEASRNFQVPRLNHGVLKKLESAELLAVELRKEWELGLDPIPNMTELLEERGIKVLLLELPENVPGLTCSVRQSHTNAKLWVIVVNAKHSLERRRLTLAYELGHRVLDPASTVDYEKAATEFAGTFLVTRDHLRGQLGFDRKALGYNELVQLKHYYGVSAAALLVRLNRYDIISSQTLRYTFQTFAKGWRKREPEPIEATSRKGRLEEPRRFQRLCYRALAERLISPSKAIELLELPLDSVDKAMLGPEFVEAETGS